MSVWASKDVEDRAEERKSRPRFIEPEVKLTPEQYHLQNDLARFRNQLADVIRQLASTALPFSRREQLESAQHFLTKKIAEIESLT